METSELVFSDAVPSIISEIFVPDKCAALWFCLIDFGFKATRV